MKTRSLKVTAVLLAATMAAGSGIAALADTPTAGVTSYTASVLSTASLPTAGFASTVMQVAIDTEEEVQVASKANVSENKKEAVTTAQSEFANIAVSNVEDYVNIRSEANTDSEVVGKLYANSAATLVEEVAGGWYHITSGRCEGYIKSEYLIVGDEEAAKKISKRIAKVGVDSLRVRKKPSTDAKIVEYVDAEEELTVLDESKEGWVKVKVGEEKGYVSAEFVELHTYFKVAESKEEEKARLKKEAEAKKKAEEEARARRNSSRSNSSSSDSSSRSERSYDAPDGSDGSAVARYALQFTGNPYVYGGSSLTNGTDCSGFVMSVYAQFGVSLPHSSYSLRSCGYSVGSNLSDAKPGDILCFSGHVGIYIGGGDMVHASTSRTGIIVSSVNEGSLITIRRIF